MILTSVVGSVLVSGFLVLVFFLQQRKRITIVIAKILEVASTQILNNYRVARCEIFELHLVDSRMIK